MTLGAEPDLSTVWVELDLPRGFPAAVEAEARTVVDRHADGRRDATDVPLVTVDPPGSMDLDQALAVEARGDGWRVHYAIADVGALVAPGGAVDAESWIRGETVYLPDGRVPLHPTPLSEDAASLLPGQVRPAVLWRIDVDGSGERTDVVVERAVVRSRSRHDYATLQGELDSGSAPEPVVHLPALGQARVARARARGAIELGLPSQEVVVRDGATTIEMRAPLPVETWNAQVSLLTGMTAAEIMLEAGVGLLRTLPPPDPGVVRRLRRAAPALGVDWPEGARPGDVLAACDARRPRDAAFLDLAGALLRGAGYTAFDDEPPEEPGHAGVGSIYAHVTAPIRRLCDRAATEVCLAATADQEVPEWARTALGALPEAMAESGRRAKAADRAAIDRVEAWLLAPRVGDVFDVAVVEHDEERDRCTVALDEPAVRARCDGRPPLGERTEVRLVEADPATGTVRFAPV